MVVFEITKDSFKIFFIKSKNAVLQLYWENFPRALGNFYAPVRPQVFVSFRRCKDTTFRLRFTNKI